MSRIASLLPRLILFAVSALLSAFVASVLVNATANNAPVSSVSEAPAYLLAGPETPSGTNVPVAFNAFLHDVIGRTFRFGAKFKF